MRESCPESLCIGIPPDFEVMIQQPVKFRIRISSAEGLKAKNHAMLMFLVTERKRMRSHDEFINCMVYL